MSTSKKQLTIWVRSETKEMVEAHFKNDNCASRTEFIEKAIRFYCGYLDTTHATAYLPRVIADVLEGKLTAFGKRVGTLLFKLGVEQAITNNILSYYTDINEGTLRELHVKCTQDVMRTNGQISFEDALKFQKGTD